MQKIIDVTNLTKEYKNLKAVDDLSFSVEKGEILGLLGPNGSGKTTTINCILSLLKFNNGKIKIFNKEIKPNSYDIKAKIGVVFQDVAVFEELTVYENINYFCGLYIKDKELRKSYVEEAISIVSLNEFRKFYPKQLSGGLLRRLNIACGIAHKPEVIFLDEPTVAVDPQSRNNIIGAIRKLNAEGATIIYTTHYMEEVEILCNRIIILDKGKMIASGTSDELKELSESDEKVIVEIKDLKSKYIEEIKSFKKVTEVNYDGITLLIKYKKGRDNFSDLIDYLKNAKITYDKIYSERPTLNDVFLELTGKELRDL